MWELKPEYRHYKQDVPVETKEDKNSNSDTEQTEICINYTNIHKYISIVFMYFSITYIIRCVKNVNFSLLPVILCDQSWVYTRNNVKSFKNNYYCVFLDRILLQMSQQKKGRFCQDGEIARLFSFTSYWFICAVSISSRHEPGC